LHQPGICVSIERNQTNRAEAGGTNRRRLHSLQRALARQDKGAQRMRNFIIAATALAVLGFSAPVVAAALAEETVVIKRDRDRDRDWHRGWHRDRDERRIYIERHHDRDHDRDRGHRERRDRD
jgi:hypothetical protein